MSALRNDLVLIPAPAPVCSAEATARRLWLERHARSPRTKRAYLAAEALLLASSGHESIKAVLRDYDTASDALRAFCDALAGYSVASVRLKMAAVVSLLKLCEAEKLIDRPVSHLLVIPKLPARMPFAVPGADLCRAAIRLEPDARNQLILKLLYYCGLRSAELLGLRWENVRHLRGPDGEPVLCAWVLGKGAKPRDVAIRPELAAELAQWKRYMSRITENWTENERVFGLKSYSALNLMCRRAWVRACVDPAEYSGPGRPGCGVHLWRHCHGTHVLAAGAEKGDVQAGLGHSRGETTDTYLHRAPVVAGAVLPWV